MTTTLAKKSTAMALPIKLHIAMSRPVATLKWLVVPRSTWPTMPTHSRANVVSTTQPLQRTRRRRQGVVCAT